MANRRMIAKNISTSRKVNRLTDRAALLYTWMIPHTDDYGRLEGDPLSIKAKVIPMRNVTEVQIEEDLESLEKNNLISKYEVNGERYLEIIGFENFQTFRADRPRRALYPEGGEVKISGIPKSNQEHTKDIPMGEISQRKRSNKISNKISNKRRGRGSYSIKYLSKIPEDDIKEFTTRFVATEKEVKSKAEDIRLYCERKGRKYSNYRSFLLNALKRDFKERDGKGGKYEHLR